MHPRVEIYHRLHTRRPRETQAANRRAKGCVAAATHTNNNFKHNEQHTIQRSLQLKQRSTQ